VRTPLWPAELVLVRHAESAGNVARDKAEAEGLPFIDIAERDMDVPLSRRGEEQARALGVFLRDHQFQPDAVLSSPYRRAEDTAAIAFASAGFEVPVVLDERLRERDFGMLDRLTHRGIEERMPEQAEARRRLGKFFYRPPGGESWCDVALRTRSLLDSLSREYPDGRVMVFAHEVVILIFRYVLLRVHEADLLRLSHDEPLANCSLTVFRREHDSDEGMTLLRWGSVDALATTDAPVTHEPDRAVASR
jgi:2,3-bisphosphoglycerate-dependent phosphoglycerate mutase